MFHKPIKIKDLSLVFPNKICFENFNAEVASGNRIAIIGCNGSGKSSLLKALYGNYCNAVTGEVFVGHPMIFSYVPQIINDFNMLSGGERFNKELTMALSIKPDILLLDEPTNHLDLYNRRNLLRMIDSFLGTIIVVSHDLELLNKCFNILWHIENGKIHIFKGTYHNYLQDIKNKRKVLYQELGRLSRQKKEMHISLMKEQQRIAKSKAIGQKKVVNNRWTKSTGDLKAMKAEKSQGNKLATMAQKKSELIEQLANLRLPEIIMPTFSLCCHTSSDTVVAIHNGTIAYKPGILLIRDINLSIGGRDKIAIIGSNGSGKTTLIKAIIGDNAVLTTGSWLFPKKTDIGYLDQHYNTLEQKDTVFDTIKKIVPHWSLLDIRRHLADFLFYSNEEIDALVCDLSGGEKARLSLAQIAVSTQKILILDEITNNLDLETTGHVINVLSEYLGAMVVISHDLEFIRALKIQEVYSIDSKTKTIRWGSIYDESC